ncbi:hypothetical protein SNOG_03805 [Parastagonospora nodorum SN15]|uniref:Uncharacterized protein n=1 Tax=Phaeosphaeria nodorum (strain SN15 / ATCC MYA-4574 / FGSC 10173) TaxID=321614 RepID=Q0UWQ9_PHANO|nr:hypothetical protein SNOG_03805 [Parastagonospora nodorum SN15]EAT89010.1 hypothetical protein SNOG_03805 [Parastagonospora nodorum SN15]
MFRVVFAFFHIEATSGSLSSSDHSEYDISRMRGRSVEDILVEAGLKEDGTEQLRPFLSHALALEDVAVPSASRMVVYSKDISSAMIHERVPKEDQPRPVLIEHADGSPITVKQFMIAAHECLSQHKDKIINNRKFLLRVPLLPITVPEPENRDLSFDPDKHDLFFKVAQGTSFPDGTNESRVQAQT